MAYPNIRYKFIGIMAAGITAYFWLQSRIVVNDTISLPTGIYFRLPIIGKPTIGNTYEIKISDNRVAIANNFGYHANAGTFEKRLVAGFGDHLRINQSGVYVNGQYIAAQGIKSAKGIALYPIESIDYQLQANEYFFLGDSPHSYDSRYFGVVNIKQIMYRTVLLWQN